MKDIFTIINKIKDSNDLKIFQKTLLLESS
jgi:hypothetical protein